MITRIIIFLTTSTWLDLNKNNNNDNNSSSRSGNNANHERFAALTFATNDDNNARTPINIRILCSQVSLYQQFRKSLNFKKEIK